MKMKWPWVSRKRLEHEADLVDRCVERLERSNGTLKAGVATMLNQARKEFVYVNALTEAQAAIGGIQCFCGGGYICAKCKSEAIIQKALGHFPAQENEADRENKYGIRTERRDAKQALREILADGPKPGAEVLAEVMGQVGCSDKTVRRAMREIGVKSKRQGFGPGSANWWSLTTEDRKDSK